MRLPLSKPARRLRRWLIPLALLALVPKCVLCLFAYAGLGAALGLGAPELCGSSYGATGLGAAWLILPAATLAFVAIRSRSRPATKTSPSD